MVTETPSSAGARSLDERTARLCERVRCYEDAVDPFVRGRHATRVYRDEPGLPVVLKRAEILARTLEELEPVVLPEQRIIGASYRRLRVHGGVSDEDAWRIGVLHPERSGFDPAWPVPDEVREELSWWNGRDVGPRSRNRLRAQHGWLSKYGIAGPHGLVQGHTLPDHGILLRAGIGTLRARIATRLEGAETGRQRLQLEAMDRCLEGLSAHCLLCAEAARRKAGEVAQRDLSR
ncbi:MAG: pyruvate formate lyase family protein, partial [Candidatus Brocadiaceae bacterium]